MLYWLFCRSWGVDFWCGYVMRENGFVGLQEQSFFFEGECRGEIVGCSVGMDGWKKGFVVDGKKVFCLLRDICRWYFWLWMLVNKMPVRWYCRWFSLVLVLLGRIVDVYHGPDDLNLVIDLVWWGKVYMSHERLLSLPGSHDTCGWICVCWFCPYGLYGEISLHGSYVGWWRILCACWFSSSEVLCTLSHTRCLELIYWGQTW